MTPDYSDIYAARCRDLTHRMVQQGIDIAVITTPESVLYLTGIDLGGFWSPQYLIVNASGEHAYVIRAIEIHWRDRWAEVSWCTNWVPYEDSEDPVDVAAAQIDSLLGTSSLRVLACETERPSLPCASFAAWQDRFTPETVVSAAALVEAMRVIKSPDEIELIRAAGRLTSIGMRAAVQAIESGATDAGAVAASFAAMYDSGSEFLADNPFVAIGPESAAAHARSTNRRPEPGEVVPIMMSGAVKRYQCPVERTYTFGEPSRELDGLLTLVCDAVESVIERIKPGMRSWEVDAIARDRYREAGVEKHFLNRLGYSFGLAYPPVWWENEIMQLRPGDERRIQEGMVFHLVPALHVPGHGFLQRSMPIVITSGGCEPLIDYPIRIKPLLA